MPRRIRLEGPNVFHVINRAVRRAQLFEKPGDYAAFMNAMAHAQQRVPVPLIAYCVMPNHFHLIVGPTPIPTLSTFMHRLTLTHSKRWHEHHGTRGTGPLYQGRFKAIVIQGEVQFTTVCRYVEENPVRAGLVQSPEEWPWSNRGGMGKNFNGLTLSRWQ